jgi:hypothetical protein
MPREIPHRRIQLQHSAVFGRASRKGFGPISCFLQRKFSPAVKFICDSGFVRFRTESQAGIGTHTAGNEFTKSPLLIG